MDPNKLVKTADWRFLDRLRQDAAYVPSGESGQRAFNFACHRTNATAASGQTGSALAASKDGRREPPERSTQTGHAESARDAARLRGGRDGSRCGGFCWGGTTNRQPLPEGQLGCRR